jgi:5-formyltetrahydrofolate cyclo-ligase
VLGRRDALGADERARLSELIFGSIATLPSFERARRMLGYSSFRSEPVTGPFLRTVLALGKVLLLPRVNRQARLLELYRVRDLDVELRPGVWGILEPDPAVCAPARLEDVDLVLVPGVAFDARGGRVGYGGGYYDRLLAACPHGPALVAAAFEVQIVETVPMGPTDRPMDRVVTERCTYPV